MFKVYIVFLLLFFLYGCGLEELFEKEGGIDRDDVNLINNFGDQAIDNAIKLYNTRTGAS